MRIKKPRKIPMIRYAVMGAIVYGLAVLLVRNLGSPYFLQDAAFMSGLAFICVMCFKVSRALGMFDLLSYGVNRIMASLRSAVSSNEGKRESYAEFVDNSDRSVTLEALVIAVVFWGFSAVVRMLS